MSTHNSTRKRSKQKTCENKTFIRMLRLIIAGIAKF